jgi:hypothetical protein
MEDILLTERQAYLAMFAFLSRHYELGLKELGGILGSMALLPDGEPADVAFASEWREAVTAAMAGTIHAALRTGDRE